MALALADAGFQPRQYLMVCHPTDDVFHERIVLCETIRPNYYVVTPDEDLYE